MNVMQWCMHTRNAVVLQLEIYKYEKKFFLNISFKCFRVGEEWHLYRYFGYLFPTVFYMLAANDLIGECFYSQFNFLVFVNGVWNEV